VRQRINKPHNTVDRQPQSLQMLGVWDCDEVEAKNGKTAWVYSVNAEIDPTALSPIPSLSPHTQGHEEEG
jgi:hypothetical protein